MTEISGMVCVLNMWTVLLCGSLSTSKTTSGISLLSAPPSPFIPHCTKPSHTESPSGSLSPTHARKTSSSWKQLFCVLHTTETAISLDGHVLPQLHTAQTLHQGYSSPPGLPPASARRPWTSSWSPLLPSLSFLPKGSLYFKSEFPKSLEISMQSLSPDPTGKALIGWGNGGGELGPSQKCLSLHVGWKEGSDFPRWQRPPELLKKDSIFPWHKKDHSSPASCWGEAGPLGRIRFHKFKSLSGAGSSVQMHPQGFSCHSGMACTRRKRWEFNHPERQDSALFTQVDSL